MLGLIYIGSTAGNKPRVHLYTRSADADWFFVPFCPKAFNALIGCAIACLCASFMMPIALNVLQRRRHVQEAAFSLGESLPVTEVREVLLIPLPCAGSLGFVLNVVALLWGLLIIAIASSPLGNHPTAATMSEYH